MEKKTRARLILAHVLRLNDRFGRDGPPRSSNTTRNARLISDDCRWQARVSQHYFERAGKPWDILELTVYDEHRLTIAYHGDELEMRLFRAGSWETIFLGFDPEDSSWILPG